MSEEWDTQPQPSQLDRIEQKLVSLHFKLDKLLEAKKPKPRKKLTGNVEFDAFWEAYPLKKGKKTALSAFNNRRKGVRADFLISDVCVRTKEDRQWIAGFPPHPTTYLNGELWNDVIQVVDVQADTLPKLNDQLEEWAVNKGYRKSYPGEEYSHYRTDLMKLHGVQS